MSDDLHPDLLALTNAVATLEQNGAVVEDVSVTVERRKPDGISGALNAILGSTSRHLVFDLTVSADEFDGDLDLDDADDQSGDGPEDMTEVPVDDIQGGETPHDDAKGGVQAGETGPQTGPDGGEP